MRLITSNNSNTKKKEITVNIIREEHNLDNITPASPKFDPSEYAPTKEVAKQRANLDVSRGKVSVYSACETPWHGLGVVTDEAVSAKHALELANLDNWNLKKVDVYAKCGDEYVPTDKFGIVRTDTNKCLGVVGERYEIFSNEECFEFLDEVLDNPLYETAGAINSGRFVWLLAKAPPAIINNSDKVNNYVMFATSHDGTSSLKIYPTNVRTVCQNTYRLSLSKKDGGISIRHSKNIRQKIEATKQALGLSHAAFEDFVEAAKHLCAKSVNNKDIFSQLVDNIIDGKVANVKVNSKTLNNYEILDAISALKDVNLIEVEQKKLEKILKKRNKVLSQLTASYEIECDTMPQTAGTAWATFNAVTHAVDHTNIFRYNGSPEKRIESRFTNLLFGRGAEFKQNAFNLLVSA